MIIAIDHGNKQIKTLHCPPFVSGIQESGTAPFGRDVLKYGGKYYTLSSQRIPYLRDKGGGRPVFHPYPLCPCKGNRGIGMPYQ